MKKNNVLWICVVLMMAFGISSCGIEKEVSVRLYRLDAEGGDTEADTGNEHKARRNAFESTLIHYYSFLSLIFKNPCPRRREGGEKHYDFCQTGIPSDSILLKAEASRR